MTSPWKFPTEGFPAGTSSGRKCEGQTTASSQYGTGWSISSFKPSTDLSLSRSGFPQSYASGDTTSRVLPYAPNPFANSTPGMISRISPPVSLSIDRTLTSLRNSQPAWEPHTPFRLKPFSTTVDVNKIAEDFEKEQQQKKELHRIDNFQQRIQKQQQNEEHAQQQQQMQQQRKMLDDMLEKIENCDSKLNTVALYPNDNVAGDKNRFYHHSSEGSNSAIQRNTMPTTVVDINGSSDAQPVSVADSSALITTGNVQRPVITNQSNFGGFEIASATGSKTTEVSDKPDKVTEIYANVLAQTRILSSSAAFDRQAAVECSPRSTQNNTEYNRSVDPSLPTSLIQSSALCTNRTSNAASLNNAALNAEKCTTTVNLLSNSKLNNPFSQLPLSTAQHTETTVRQLGSATSHETRVPFSVTANNSNSLSPRAKSLGFEKTSFDQKNLNPLIITQTQLRSDIHRQRSLTPGNSNSCQSNLASNDALVKGRGTFNGNINSQTRSIINASYPEKRSGDLDMPLVQNSSKKFSETDYRFRTTTAASESNPIQFNAANGNISSTNENLFTTGQTNLIQNYCPKACASSPSSNTSECTGTRLAGDFSRGNSNYRLPATNRLPERSYMEPIVQGNNGASSSSVTTDFNSLKRQPMGLDSQKKPPLKLNGIDVKPSLPIYSVAYNTNSFMKKGPDYLQTSNSSFNSTRGGTNVGFINRQSASQPNQFGPRMSYDVNHSSNSSDKIQTVTSPSSKSSARPGEVWLPGNSINRNSSASASFESRPPWWDGNGVTDLTSNASVSRVALHSGSNGLVVATGGTQFPMQPLQERGNINVHVQPQRSILKKNRSYKNILVPGTMAQSQSHSTARRIHGSNTITPYYPPYRSVAGRDVSASRQDVRQSRSEGTGPVRFNQHDSSARNQQKRVRFKF